jgi:hypothetical protein
MATVLGGAIAGLIETVGLDLFPQHLLGAARAVTRCDHVAVGPSPEGIALGLGVSLDTVLTYRKRACARLGISSQNELLRPIMM